MDCAAPKGQIRVYRSAVARYKTATCGMWSCPDDGYRWMGGGECGITPSSSSGSQASWLVGAFSPSSLDRGKAGFVRNPKLSLRGDCQLCFPLHLISCFAKTAIYMFYTSHCDFHASQNALFCYPFRSAAEDQTCSLKMLSKQLVAWHPRLFSARQPLKAKRDSASKRKSLSSVSVLGVMNGIFVFAPTLNLCLSLL